MYSMQAILSCLNLSEGKDVYLKKYQISSGKKGQIQGLKSDIWSANSTQVIKAFEIRKENWAVEIYKVLCEVNYVALDLKAKKLRLGNFFDSEFNKKLRILCRETVEIWEIQQN